MANIISRITTWAAGQVLKAADLNGEFNNIVNLINNINSGSQQLAALSVANATTSSGAMAFGQNHVFQVVSATTSTAFNTGSTSFQKSNLAVNITPTSSSSKIIILACFTGTNSTSGDTAFYDLFRGNSALSGQTQGITCFTATTAGSPFVPANIMYLDSPSTTSSTTYTVGVRCDNGAAYVGFNNTLQVIIAIEVQ